MTNLTQEKFELLAIALRVSVSRFYITSADTFRFSYWKKIPSHVVEEFGLECCMELEDDDCSWQYAYRFKARNFVYKYVQKLPYYMGVTIEAISLHEADKKLFALYQDWAQFNKLKLQQIIK